MERKFVEEFDLGFLMGLLVASGSFTGDKISPSIHMKSHVNDPLPLEALNTTFGGKIYGPYIHDGRHYRVWTLRGKTMREILPIIERYLPPSKKRDQFETWLAKYDLEASVA